MRQVCHRINLMLQRAAVPWECDMIESGTRHQPETTVRNIKWSEKKNCAFNERIQVTLLFDHLYLYKRPTDNGEKPVRRYQLHYHLLLKS